MSPITGNGTENCTNTVRVSVRMQPPAVVIVTMYPPCPPPPFAAAPAATVPVIAPVEEPMLKPGGRLVAV